MNLDNLIEQNIRKYGEYNLYWFEEKWWGIGDSSRTPV